MFLFAFINYYENINGKVVNITDEIPFDIPDNWCWIRIKNIFKITNGFTPSRSNSALWLPEINWITVEDINQQGKYINKTNQHISNIACSKDRIISANSIILCCTSASIGKLTINNIPISTNQQFNGLTPKFMEFIDIEFAYAFFKLLKNKLLDIAGITTFPFVSTDKLGNLLFPLPTISIQKNISHNLLFILKEIE